MSEYWTKYWKEGHLTSFGTAFTGNYTGSLKEYWLTLYNSLDAKTRILDIATGNGALIDLAILNKAKFATFIGVDQADVMAPVTIIDCDYAQLLGSTFIENLPFEKQSFDIVISQYGIEYANLNKSLTSVSKVLVCGGRFNFIVHDNNSIIVKNNVRTLEATKTLVGEDGLLVKLKKLIDCIELNGMNSEQFSLAKNSLNTACMLVSKYYQQAIYETNFPIFMTEILKSNRSYSRRLEMLSLYQEELKGQIVRLTDLQNAAFGNEKMNAFTEQCKKSGLVITESRYIHDEQGNVIGKSIEGYKK